MKIGDSLDFSKSQGTPKMNLLKTFRPPPPHGRPLRGALKWYLVIFVDLESVDVDDGLGHVGEHGPEIVDPLSDRRRTVAHHETNSLILVETRKSQIKIIYRIGGKQKSFYTTPKIVIKFRKWEFKTHYLKILQLCIIE
jgi:hypothetical protein